MGAAMLAGLAVDAWTLAGVRARQPGDAVVRPKASAAEARRRMAVWARAVAATRAFTQA
jgi:glycerol kinase